MTASCATLTLGTKQTVAITTSGADGATCTILNEARETIGTVTTPGSIELGKSRKDLTVSCEKPGYEPASRTVASDWSSKAKYQGPQGYLVDYASGAMWEYPSPIDVPLTPLPAATKKKVPVS